MMWNWCSVIMKIEKKEYTNQSDAYFIAACHGKAQIETYYGKKLNFSRYLDYEQCILRLEVGQGTIGLLDIVAQ